MGKELENIAEKLAETINGKGGGVSFDKLLKLFATPGGKQVLAHLLSDGGQKIKQAAASVKNGDMNGIQNIIASIAETEEGRKILGEMMRETEK